ncbi:MAG: tRNA (adenosine(37)-N6)-dimethylallyltransferase MiaA [Chitinophagaceae bacterium]|nr:tRNA (adenosine(37)-N6)-dimethylallyltransferase MiaA [Chitinophagaceae bacterium]MCW5929186.1 tRNA (adenosine(37)-N6)-dimethylallyltransferase MiaA [Chitinophagaceae bacterium]
MFDNKTCVIIVGPTASGKTALSLRLAEHYGTEIISADSRQCYRELNIGVAKPSTAELNRIRHYFINSHSIQQEVNAGTFEGYALEAVNNIFQKQDMAVMVGGTGLYIKAFCEGLDRMPEINESIRADIRKQYEAFGIDWLQQMVQQHDPLYYSQGEILNPQRMLRALEVKMSAGRSIVELQSERPVDRSFKIIKIGVELSREQVYDNINRRVGSMMDMGLLDEVKSLGAYRHLNALQTVGYSELYEFLDGKITLEKAVEDIRKNTRHYAKRQLTWFNRDEDIHWFHPGDLESITGCIRHNK